METDAWYAFESGIPEEIPLGDWESPKPLYPFGENGKIFGDESQAAFFEKIINNKTLESILLSCDTPCSFFACDFEHRVIDFGRKELLIIKFSHINFLTGGNHITLGSVDLKDSCDALLAWRFLIDRIIQVKILSREGVDVKHIAGFVLDFRDRRISFLRVPWIHLIIQHCLKWIAI